MSSKVLLNFWLWTLGITFIFILVAALPVRAEVYDVVDIKWQGDGSRI